MNEGSLTARLDKLERTVRQLEDHISIYQVMAAYGPAADSGSGDVMEEIFEPEARYETGISVLEGAPAIREMIETLPLHRALLERGVAHMVTMPVVEVDGDRAVAFCHGQVVRRDGDRFEVWRTSSNRWELERSNGRWRVLRRVNRLLDGTEEPRDLFREALLGHFPLEERA